MMMIGVKAPCIPMATSSMNTTTTTTPAPRANRVSLMAPFSPLYRFLPIHRSHGFTAPNRRTRRWYSMTAS
jgi:hypothetical protein